MTVGSFNPLARAVRIKSSCKTSSMLARVIRVSIAAKPNPKVIAGKIIDEVVSMPLTGSNPNQSANSIINIGPIQKCGIAEIVKLSKLANLSGHFLTLSAARIPKGRPIKIAKDSARSANLAVAGRRSANKSLIGFLECMEMPKSPCASLFK